MIHLYKTPIFIAMFLFVFSPNLHAKDVQVEDVKINAAEVARWNKFADNLVTLSQQLINNRDIYTRENTGGYGGIVNDLEFYREVRNYDSKTDKLISNVKWERKSPQKIHGIDINIYDDQGRVVRDYTAYYLPHYRNAPYQTLINIHSYNENLHSIRQFDANDDLIFEFCSGTYQGKPVKISLDYHEIPDRIDEISEKSQRETYSACFDQLAKSAGKYLSPLNEL